MRDLNPLEMKSVRVPGASKSMNANKSDLFINLINNPLDASSFDHHDPTHKVKTSAGFDTLSSDADTLKLEDIERIKFDLNEEKNKIRFQENRLNKLIKKFKQKEDELEDEKKKIQKRKDGN